MCMHRRESCLLQLPKLTALQPDAQHVPCTDDFASAKGGRGPLSLEQGTDTRHDKRQWQHGGGGARAHLRGVQSDASAYVPGPTRPNTTSRDSAATTDACAATRTPRPAHTAPAQGAVLGLPARLPLTPQALNLTSTDPAMLPLPGACAQELPQARMPLCRSRVPTP